MSAPSDPVDFIGIVVAVVTFFASKEIAIIISPYIAIVIAAVVAAGWALSKTGELSGVQSIKFITLRVGTALIFAVTLAELLHTAFAWAHVRLTMVPIAFVIALVKDLDELKEYKTSIVDWFKGRKDA